MPQADETLDALTRLLADGGPAWLGYFTTPDHGSRSDVRSAYRGAERNDARLASEVPVAIFHDAARGAGERRVVTLRLVDTPLERGHAAVSLAFDWPTPAFTPGGPYRASCRLLLHDDVLDVAPGDAACGTREDGACLLELRLAADWVERDLRPDELLAALLGVLVIVHAGVDESAPT